MAKESVNILKDKIDIVDLLAQLNAALSEEWLAFYQLPHQLQRSPLQHRQRLTQGLAGEQCSQHQQQARRRKIRQRRQQRL